MSRLIANWIVYLLLCHLLVGCAARPMLERPEKLLRKYQSQQEYHIREVVENGDTVRFDHPGGVYDVSDHTVHGRSVWGQVVTYNILDSSLQGVVVTRIGSDSLDEEYLPPRDFMYRLKHPAMDKIHGVQLIGDSQIVKFADSSGRLWDYNSTVSGISVYGDSLVYEAAELEYAQVMRQDVSIGKVMAFVGIVLLVASVASYINDPMGDWEWESDD